MKLYTEIHDFFNEGRPRTVNQDVVDIKKGQYIYQGEKPKEPEKTILKRKEPNKKDFSKQPTDIDQKSSFKKGEVHRIVFKTAFKDQKRAYFSIYRKISEQEYNDQFTILNERIAEIEEERISLNLLNNKGGKI